ncbi:hypothetical protein AAFF_G00063630 [Aldrovandia affinis]|uniref:Uncharacterized protein n=1 Tax=Aldrovandia affinis TaxID=143900 RepID=A0AAD7T3K0_9TELE|nr:hypothetical protein AAFF_G00063630 [Aldrovandia affinis]
MLPLGTPTIASLCTSSAWEYLTRPGSPGASLPSFSPSSGFKPGTPTTIHLDSEQPCTSRSGAVVAKYSVSASDLTGRSCQGLRSQANTLLMSEQGNK